MPVNGVARRAVLAAALAVTWPASSRAQEDGGAAEEEEVEVDFDEEEKAAEQEKKEMMAKAGAGSGDSVLTGIKLFVDLLVDHQIGDQKFEFRPNHTYVIVQANVYDDVGFLIHVSDDPVFFELQYNLTPRIRFGAGKLFIPFGTNEFHHIIGGRVDELSHFLPETWGDFGISMSHQLYDGEDLSLDYVVYAVNGFAGVDGPVIADGSFSDNNLWKGLGTRVRAGFLGGKVKATLSTYLDAWDVNNEHKLLFYALGIELLPGLIDIPVLNRLRIRGEWARGEIQLPDQNYQSGILEYAYARTGYYLELQYNAFERVAFRLRTGRINPDNRVTDSGDVEVYEPAVLIGLGSKLWWTLAYQLTAKPGFDYSAKDPPDVVYAKFFLQF